MEKLTNNKGWDCVFVALHKQCERMDNSMDISVIIINYMTYAMTIKAMESVIENTKDIEYEIILVDNASKNDDAKRLEEYVSDKKNIIKYIKNEENLGFGKGNNIALKEASGKYILFLNSDCELTQNTIKKSIDYLKDNDDIGALGTRLITPDGKLDAGSKRGFPTPFSSMCYFLGLHKISKNPKFDQYKLFHLNEFKLAEVDAISGAYLLSRKDILDDVGGFDEAFFMYGEDLDLCYKIKQKGFIVFYNPLLGDVIHHRGKSSKHRKFRTIVDFYDAMLIFYNKNFRKDYNFLVTILVYIGVGIVFTFSIIKNFFKGIWKVEE